MVGKLPRVGTPEWDMLVASFIDCQTRELEILAKESGYANYDSLANAMRRRGVRRGVPLSMKPRYDKPVEIEGDVLIECDEQIPFHDAEFMNHILDLAYSWGIQQGISAGDAINMSAFSKFGHKPEDAMLETEILAAKGCLVSMHDAVPNWLVVQGNHTFQIIRYMNEQIKIDAVIALIEGRDGKMPYVQGTDYYYCMVNGTWRVTHPRNISVLHAKVPGELCAKFGCNVAAGHGHLVGFHPSKCGKYLAVDVGICADPMRLDYYAQRDSTRPVMNQGALLLKQGAGGKFHPHLVSPLWTDWAAMKRMYKREI